MSDLIYKVVEKRDPNGSSYRSMELPRIVLSGLDALQGIGKVVKRLGLKGPAVMVNDDMTYDIAGKEVETLLSHNGVQVESYTIKEADMATVKDLEAYLKDSGAGFVLAVGGGRPIDVAKLSSFRSNIPYISIPTSASHDGVMSSRASIIDGGRKVSFEAHTPIAVIGDSGIISKAPHRFLAAGCGDIISNLTAVLDWELAYKLKNDPFSTYAATLSKMSAMMVLENADKIKPGHEPSARLVIKALFSSGVAMSIAGSSRPASGSEHLFSHALDMIAPQPALHGEQCGVGSIISMYLHGGDWRQIRGALQRIGAPVNADGLGIDNDTIVKALLMAQSLRPERYTILSGGLTEEAARMAGENTGVLSGD